jgi:hypothetical protein
VYHFWEASSSSTLPWDFLMPNATDENGINFFPFFRLLLRYFCSFDVEEGLVSDESDLANGRLASWLVLIECARNFVDGHSKGFFATANNLQVDVVQLMGMRLHFLFSHFSQIR